MTSSSDKSALPVPVLVVLKLSSSGRHRASWFSGDQADAAERVAASLGYTLIRLTSEANERAAASKLPRGGFSAKHGPQVSTVSQALLDKVLRTIAPNLIGLVGEKRTSNRENTAARGTRTKTVPVLIDVSAAPTPSTPSDWSDIQEGSIVLARDHHDEAWYEAVVLSVARDVCQLKWRDYPGYPVITRQRHQLGLMFPAQSPQSAA